MITVLVALQAQFHPFRFAFFSDTRIGSPDGKVGLLETKE
jgi:hypothetical protein